MSVDGKYFIVVSQKTRLVLDVKGGGTITAGTPVTTFAKHGGNNQQWFFDPVKSTIRSRANSNLCLTINANNRLIVDTFHAGDRNQTWVLNRSRNTIDNKSNTNKVIDVVNGSTVQGAELCLWDFYNGENQLWFLEPQPKVYFYIHDQINGKVMDVCQSNSAGGTPILMYQKNAIKTNNQLWFEDIYGNLRSKLNESVVLDATDGYLRLGWNNIYKTRTYWSIQGECIVNVFNTNEVLDVSGSSTANGAKIIAFQATGGYNQKWTFEFAL